MKNKKLKKIDFISANNVKLVLSFSDQIVEKQSHLNPIILADIMSKHNLLILL